MKKYEVPTITPHKLKAGKLLLNGSLGNESYKESGTTPKFDDED